MNKEGEVERSTTGLPCVDSKGNKLSHDYGYFNYKKYQRVVIQELPERAPPGQLPRSIEVILENDLVDKAKPGDRVEVTGVYKSIEGEKSKTSAVFRTVIIGTGIEASNSQKQEAKLDAKDISNIKKLAKRKDVFEVLANSVAPSIYGHHSVKKGILLQLLGGTARTVEGSGTRIRGDINMLLVGDPSTAKSQLLRQVMEIAPLAINTTGRGSTGVGLTAAVIIDKDTGERNLEAGAMVLADKGVVCIDEFDKMSQADRVAIHEVMEQQTVTISKAGIHASLNARCSVIAAANPIYGDYDTSISAAKNIGLPDSLLSRFDLLFVVLDDKDPNVNSRIAERVILNHRFKTSGDKGVSNIDHNDIYVEPEAEETIEEKHKVYENDFNAMIKGEELKPSDDVLNRAFLKKYLSYTKSTVQPVMNSEAVEFLSSSYSLLRQKGSEPDQIKEKKLPITARTLETLIRLATAHAKLRLSKAVTVEDMQVALKLLNFSIFTHDDNDVKEPTDPKDVNMEEEEEQKEPKRSTRRAKTHDNNGGLEVNMAAARKQRNDNKNALQKENHRPNTRNFANNLSSKEQVDYVLNSSMGEMDEHRLNLSKKTVFKLLSILKRKHCKADSFTIDDIHNELQTQRTSSRLSGIHNKEEIGVAVKSLESEKKVMLIEGG